ncbi:MAG: hypothetical protein CL670_00285 [Balneola sp.]|nr:hypothetical protein [Balneola sp.]MBE77573.1 hypothetical protein [Balneola sp.]
MRFWTLRVLMEKGIRSVAFTLLRRSIFAMLSRKLRLLVQERTWLPVIVFLVLLYRQKNQPRLIGATAKKELRMATFR